MKASYKTLVLILLILLLPGLASAQVFGKNKVQYRTYNWQYLQSKHFDVYFYDGGKYIAEFGADVLEDALGDMQRDFDYNIKKRVPVVIYNSHNEFQQTNVLIDYMEEGIGGVTEMFKNRMVIPFEGDYEQFRHVLHHELVHAYMNDMIYGASVQSIVSGAVRLQLPLWYAEGMAEYISLGWNTRSDMILRDGTIYGYLGSMSPYQQGQALMRYIAEKYGREKIGDILRRINITKDIERGFQAALGIDLEKLAEQWELAMKRRYWPDIADRSNPEEFATRLTDHIEEGNYLNVGPAISPNGDKIAYISNKNGYADVYLISAINGEVIGKLLGGQRSANLEELKWLSAAMSWSPDGKYIVLAVKAGDQDALTIIDASSGDYDQYKFGLDGIYDANWSPTGDKIAFMGTRDGMGDIYSFDVATKKIHRITNDYFSDKNPAWSPDGTKMLFVSDRKDYVDHGNNNDDGNGASETPDFHMQDHNYRTMDIYAMNADGTGIERLTFDPSNDGFPVWAPDGTKFAYTSEANGISNIYIMDMETRQSYPITNALTGCFQLSWSQEGSKLAFVSYYEGGFDIFMIRNPLDKEPKAEELTNTVFFDQLEKEREKPAIVKESEEAPLERVKKLDLSQYIFDDQARRYAEAAVRDTTVFNLDPSEYLESDGGYKARQYKLKFTPDIVAGNYGYDTFFGVQGSSVLQFSDMLGDHVMMLATDLYFDLRNSNFQLAYYHLPRLTDYGVGIFNQANFFTTYAITGGYIFYIPIRLRNYGGYFVASRPFSRYSRIEFTFTGQRVSQEYLDPSIREYDVAYSVLRSSLNLVRDTVLWGFFGPVDGERGNIMLSYSPPLGKKNERISFFTMVSDYRKYFRLGRDYTFALRMTGGFSEGENPEAFFLGGVPNWLNRKFNGDIRTDLSDIFFSYWIDPLRGSRYYELDGNRFALMNAELRFPFIKELVLGLPPLSFQNVQGNLFMDAGAAWWNNNFQSTSRDVWNRRQFEDMRVGFGLGINTYFSGFFLMKFDIAWDYDLNGISKPLYYISLGGNW